MKGVFQEYRELVKSSSGVDKMEYEMQRQLGDALSIKKSALPQLRRFVEALSARRELLLIGMGASHFVNQIFAWQLQKIGIDAVAVLASDYLAGFSPLRKSLILLTSQSGESVEIVHCLEQLKGRDDIFGLTLTEESTLARESFALVAPGGREKAYAGTRSVTLSVAMLAYVSEMLGAFPEHSVTKSLEWMREQTFPQLAEAVDLLGNSSFMVALGRGLSAGAARLFCLGCQELSWLPSHAYECGQFRHGPMQILQEDSLVVLFRPGGSLGDCVETVVHMRQVSRCNVLVFDCSGAEPLPEALTLSLPSGEDMPAILSLLPTLQLAMIGYGCRKNPLAGVPRLSSKVTKH